MNRQQIRFLRRTCTSVQIRLSEESPLRGTFERGDEISLLTDGSIFPHVAQQHEWNFNETRFIGQVCDAASYHLIDVGANVGLYTRQVLLNYQNVHSASCFEPSPDNVEHLARNIGGMPTATVHNFGLGTTDGELTFFTDDVNGGNFSFNENAVAGRNHHVIKAPIRKISEQLLDDCMGDEARKRRLIWKSDTQGLDEVLMSELPLGFWQRVDLAVFEGWRIPKPEFDAQAFAAVLKAFDFVYIMGSRNKRLQRTDAEQCMHYLSGTDRRWADVFLSRRELS
ncbi:FkbM family methyltransferase [Ruegeria sp. HU-ET01832]|uniref:FkbM family methyltransferase n=1 Tax=Ruegeria sp. HU-ET01832 TaxID=3135906 RepID=UPI0033401484